MQEHIEEAISTLEILLPREQLSERDIEAIARILTEVKRLQADAARWAYVRDVLSRTYSVHMGGEHSYCFRQLQRHRGPTITVAIDKAIAEAAEAAKQTDTPHDAANDGVGGTDA